MIYCINNQAEVMHRQEGSPWSYWVHNDLAQSVFVKNNDKVIDI